MSSLKQLQTEYVKEIKNGGRFNPAGRVFNVFCRLNIKKSNWLNFISKGEQNDKNVKFQAKF